MIKEHYISKLLQFSSNLKAYKGAILKYLILQSIAKNQIVEVNNVRKFTLWEIKFMILFYCCETLGQDRIWC